MNNLLHNKGSYKLRVFALWTQGAKAPQRRLPHHTGTEGKNSMAPCSLSQRASSRTKARLFLPQRASLVCFSLFFSLTSLRPTGPQQPWIVVPAAPAKSVHASASPRAGGSHRGMNFHTCTQQPMWFCWCMHWWASASAKQRNPP